MSQELRGNFRRFLSVVVAVLAPVLLTIGAMIVAKPYLWPLHTQPPHVIGELIGAGLPAVLIGFPFARLVGGWPWQRSIFSSAVVSLVPAIVISLFVVRGIEAENFLARITVKCGNTDVLFPLGAAKTSGSENSSVIYRATRGKEFFQIECVPIPQALDHAALSNAMRNWALASESRSISTIHETTQFKRPSVETIGSMMIMDNATPVRVDFRSVYSQPGGHFLSAIAASPNGVPDDVLEFRARN